MHSSKRLTDGKESLGLAELISIFDRQGVIFFVFPVIWSSSLND